MKHLTILLPVLFICVFSSAFSNSLTDSLKTDSSNIASNRVFSEEKLLLHSNFAVDFPATFLFCGNNYLASYSTDYLKRDNRLGLNMYDEYKFFYKSISNFKRSKSSLLFRTGSKKNLEFALDHNQNLSDLFNFQLNYLTARSEGFYKQEAANFNKINISLNGRNKKDNYRFNVHYFNFKFKNEESGGLIDANIFKSESAINTQLYETNLNTSISVYIDKNAGISNHLVLYGHKKRIEIDTVVEFKQTFELFINSDFKFNRQKTRFVSTSQEGDYFMSTYFDSTATFDTLWFEQISHVASLGINNLMVEQLNIKLQSSVYLQNTSNKFNQNGIDSSFESNRIGIRGEITSLKNTFLLGFDFYRGYVPDRKYYSNTGFDLMLCYNFSDWLAPAIEMKRNEYVPTITDNFFYSNHFIWKNDFNLTRSNEVKLSLESGKLNTFLEANFEKVDGFIYYDENALPRQFDESIRNTSVKVVNKLPFGIFRWENNVIYRNSSAESVVRFPDFSFISNFYISTMLFKRHLGFEPGIDCRYFTGFYGNAYQPATGKFYLQNNSVVGNYPYFDIYIKLGIKSASLFLMLEHANAGLNGKDYFMAPDYPMPGRAIKFIVKWDFLN